MDLKTFIKETILEIDGALKEASDEFNTHDYKYGRNNSENNTIDFEVQIYASNSTEVGGEGKIGVASLGLGGRINGSSENESGELSNVKFSVVRVDTPKTIALDRIENEKVNPKLKVSKKDISQYR